MRNMLYAGVAIAALAIPGAAFAQSTGSIVRYSKVIRIEYEVELEFHEQEQQHKLR